MELKDHRIEELAQFAMQVMRTAGDEALSYYGKGKLGLKFDEELVTEAELGLIQFFYAQLHEHFPDHSLFENTRKINEYTHEGKRYMWIHDALDGVANFQAGIPMWGMSLALIENFWPILGRFFMPVTGDCFHARAGHKAYCGDIEINAGRQGDIDDESLLLTFSRFHQHYDSEFPGKIRSMGCTSAHICYVAMGRADAAVIAHENYQTLAAVSVILEEAGGKIYTMDGKEFLLNEYSDDQRIDGHLLVASPDICPQVLSYLQRKD
ncbi:MAG: inositol monophosphatase family protein [Thermodesulfobacteriota bacterium]|nr:inositol monophosphatase family protein [Thermodesulfobacteriota bacterium]